MKTADLLQALKENKEKMGTFQIHLNSGNLEGNGNVSTGVEFTDLYFTDFKILRDTLLAFGNMNRKPISRSDKGVELYAPEVNSSLYIDTEEIENIEELEGVSDWFDIPSSRIFNVYMRPKNPNGNRNIITIGFMG